MEKHEVYIPKTLVITLIAFILAVVTPKDVVLAQRDTITNTRIRITSTPTPTPTSAPAPTTGLTDGQIDTDDDGDVDIYDYNLFVSQYGWTGPAAANYADFDDDGDVDANDFESLKVGFGFVTPQWKTNQSVIAVCLPNGTVGLNVTFTNTESSQSLSMDVLATDTQTGSFLDLGTVPAQSQATGTIQTGETSLNAGVVVFDLAWTSGDPRTDQRFSNYSAISCVKNTSTPTPTTPPSTLTPTTTSTTTPTPTTPFTPTPTTPSTPTPTPALQACAINYTNIAFSTMNGATNKEGNTVSNQYQGVTFSLENCSTTNPRVAQVGAPMRAFNYGLGSPDGAAVGQSFGPYFITDSGFFGADDPICTLVINYLPAYRTSSVHLDLLDIDGFINNAGTAIYEKFSVKAYDANGNQVASQEVLRSDNAYDGKAIRVNLLSQPTSGLVGAPKPAIAQVKISGTSNR